MDAAAKAQLAEAPGEPVNHIFGAPWLLSTDGYQFTYLDKPAFFRCLTESRGYEYWLKRERLTAQVLPTIDTSAIDQALKETPLSHRTWVVKQASGFCAVGIQMKRYQKWAHDHCPRCGLPEDAPHVVRCKRLQETGCWTKTLDALVQWMDKSNTMPELRDNLIFYLRQWNEEPTISPRPLTSATLRRAIEQQSRIGWGEAFNGFLSRSWAEAQQEHLQLTTRGSARRWVIQLIKKLWATAWDFWADRNGYLHKPQAQEQTLNTQIQAFYDQERETLHPTVRRWMEIPLATLLTRPRRFRHAWLRHMQLLTTTYQAREQNDLRLSRELMRRWLQGAG